jgi:iron complex transport system substrate-binding protein
MLEHTPAATRLVADMRRRIQRVKERTAALPRPRLLYVLDSQPLVTVGPGSFIHQLIELAGAENIGAVTGQAYPRISMDEALEQNPDVIIFPGGNSEDIPEPEQQRWQRWHGMTAVRTRRLYQIDSRLVNRPGPRIVEGLERLAEFLHPEDPHDPSSHSSSDPSLASP